MNTNSKQEKPDKIQDKVIEVVTKADSLGKSFSTVKVFAGKSIEVGDQIPFITDSPFSCTQVVKSGRVLGLRKGIQSMLYPKPAARPLTREELEKIQVFVGNVEDKNFHNPFAWYNDLPKEVREKKALAHRRALNLE